MANIPAQRGDAEQYFLKLIADEITKGRYTPGSQFLIKSQLHVNRKFRQLYGPMYSDRFLKSRLKNIEKRYKEFSELLNGEGIQWSTDLNIVYGNENLLKEEHKKRFKHGFYHGEPNYMLMCEVLESGIQFN